MASQIQGLDRLNKKLARLPAVAEKRIRAAMEQGAAEIVAMMKSLVATDTGDLKDSITWIWGDAPKGMFPLVVVTGGRGAGRDLRITVVAGDSSAYYARWIEFGTAAHNVAQGGGTKSGLKRIMASGGGVQHPGTAAQPFFFVSYRANRKKVRSRITRAINKAAKEVAAGGG